MHRRVFVMLHGSRRVVRPRKPEPKIDLAPVHIVASEATPLPLTDAAFCRASSPIQFRALPALSHSTWSLLSVCLASTSLTSPFGDVTFRRTMSSGAVPSRTEARLVVSTVSCADIWEYADAGSRSHNGRMPCFYSESALHDVEQQMAAVP